MLLLIINPPLTVFNESAQFTFVCTLLCILDILEAQHLFSVTQPFPCGRFGFLSVHNYHSLFCPHKDWIYWIHDTTKTKSCHSNVIDVNTAMF